MSHTLPDPDRQRLHRDLTTLRDGLGPLRLIAAKKASVVSRQSSHGQCGVAPIPLNLGAWDLLQDIEHYAQALGLALRLRYRHAPAEALLGAALAHEEHLMARPDAAHVRALAQAYARRMAGQLTPPPERVMVGACPGCGMDLWCTGEDLASGWCVCPGCDRTLKILEVQQARILRLATSGARGTAAALGRLLTACGISVRRQTIAQWKKRGLIRPVGDQDGRPVYLLWDVWRALQRGV